MTDKKKDPVAEQEQHRANLEKSMDTFFDNKRGGQFFAFGDRRVHESELTADERKTVGLPPLPAPTPPAKKE